MSQAVTRLQACEPCKGKQQRLSPRQLRILGLAAQGFLDKQIAQELGVRPSTINMHWRRIFRKLEVHNCAAAVAQRDYTRRLK